MHALSAENATALRLRWPHLCAITAHAYRTGAAGFSEVHATHRATVLDMSSYLCTHTTFCTHTAGLEPLDLLRPAKGLTTATALESQQGSSSHIRVPAAHLHPLPCWSLELLWHLCCKLAHRAHRLKKNLEHRLKKNPEHTRLRLALSWNKCCMNE